jgi:Protein-L-isoaspartate(D-aspartate) O-methyltransferase (PCMT)
MLDQLLRLAPIEPGAGLRILELDTDTQGGASAAELAVRAEGSVVSVSTATRVTGAARAAHGPRTDRLTFHAGSLAAGWPDRAPYDLVLAWPILRRVPHAWVLQCAPSARLLVPVWLSPPAGGEAGIRVVRLTLNQHGLLNWPPHLATLESDSEPGPWRWSLCPAVPDSDLNSYGFGCGCPRCVPPAELAALAEPVATGSPGRWVRPISPTAPAHLVAVEYATVGKAWLSLCGAAFNAAGTAPPYHRRCTACALLQTMPPAAWNGEP